MEISVSLCCKLKLKPGEYFREISVIFQLRYFEQLWQFVHVCVCASGRHTLVSDAALDSVVCPGPGWQHFWRSRQVSRRWFVSCWHHNSSRTSFWTPSPQPGHEHWADLQLADTLCHHSTLALVLDANQTKTLAFWTGVCFSSNSLFIKLTMVTWVQKTMICYDPKWQRQKLLSMGKRHWPTNSAVLCWGWKKPC